MRYAILMVAAGFLLGGLLSLGGCATNHDICNGMGELCLKQFAGDPTDPAKADAPKAEPKKDEAAKIEAKVKADQAKKKSAAKKKAEPKKQAPAEQPPKAASVEDGPPVDLTR